jgi:hypothetical protein
MGRTGTFSRLAVVTPQWRAGAAYLSTAIVPGGFQMRCDECGRPIKNAEMWQLASDPQAPTARSMQQLCWDCRRKAATKPAEQDSESSVLEEAADVARRYGADHI